MKALVPFLAVACIAWLGLSGCACTTYDKQGNDDCFGSGAKRWLIRKLNEIPNDVRNTPRADIDAAIKKGGIVKALTEIQSERVLRTGKSGQLQIANLYSL